jgi:two-component system OmpR family sensor kinase
MSKGRLTRQELGWLLTQEAQGAAERLRKGVQVLRTQAPEAEPTDSATVDDSLDALDDVMRMLSNMHQKSATSRRGRIDVAALLWEISPDARVQIEPGGGTEVFGEESELRRMLHVLLDHAGGGRLGDRRPRGRRRGAALDRPRPGHLAHGGDRARLVEPHGHPIRG